jgi:Polyketide cyclase / dehydrase and lipid transport
MLRRAVLLIVAVVAALAAGVIGVGYALPQNHVASRTISLSASPDDVFAAIWNVDRYPNWRKDVQRVDVLSLEPLRWRELSGGDAITFEVAESRRPELHTVRIADPDLPFGGTWTYALTPDGSGTRLAITERGEVYNPVFRFLSRFVFGHTASIDRFADALRAHLSAHH